MEVILEDLEYNKYGEGYRIVYFYDNYYKVGTFSKMIGNFMVDFVTTSPIENEEDIPNFISIDDLLNRYLNDIIEAKAVAIFTTSGNMIEKKERR